MFRPLDQTDMALDALDGLLEVSRGSVTWLAMLGVAPARWAQRLPPWPGAHHPGWPMWRRCGGLPSRWVLFALFPVISCIQINFYVHMELGK